MYIIIKLSCTLLYLIHVNHIVQIWLCTIYVDEDGHDDGEETERHKNKQTINRSNEQADEQREELK